MEDVTVLVVDDQAVFRDAMSAVVAATDGFTVVGTAASGEEALRAAEALGPRLVLLDVHLPGIDGVETARRLAAGVDRPAVVLLSTDPALDLDLVGCGAAAYLPKDQLTTDRLASAWRERGDRWNGAQAPLVRMRAGRPVSS